MSESTLRAIQSLANWLRESRYTTVFTGAGMSTESGLPDFRSARGLWRRAPESLASREALEHDFDEFTAFYRYRLRELAKHQPNRAHRILADWGRRSLVKALVTQNVDGFHQAAGSPSIAMHGDLNRVRCDRCEQAVNPAVYLQEGQERCRCGGPRRPGVVLFGERLPAGAMEAAIAAAEASDLFLVLGTSLEVAPANWLPEVARAAGARLALIDAEPTRLDAAFDRVIHAGLGDTLEQVDRLLKRPG